MAAISTWSTTAASNNAAVPDGAPENWKPSEVNNWGRETMAAVRTWYEDAEWIDWGHSFTQTSGTTMTIAADHSAIYHANRRIRVVGSSTGTIYGTITSGVFSTPTLTVTIVFDSGSMASETLTVSVGINSADSPSIDARALSDAAGLVTFPAATRMLFQQTAAPTGWTKDTTAAINDIALRLTTGTVTNSTGNDKFSTVFGTGKSTASHTLVIGEIPAHTHTYNANANKTVGDPGGTTSSANQSGSTTGSAGGGGGHSHNLNDLNLDYYEAIIASKD